MLDPAITLFFSERKEAWLKKNIKTDMDEFEKKEQEQACEEVFALSTWLPNAARRAGQMSISTHPCTFSHPSARKNKNGYASSVIANNPRECDGFLRTGNVEVKPDALGNAAALDVHKFLTLVMEDGKTLLTHLEQNSELASELLKQPGTEADALRAGFLKMVQSDQENITSSKIKQVYFPVDEDEYHLLSILSHSGHLFELRKRIDHLRFSEATKEARECKKANKHHETGYQDILGLTTIGYGGTKPQNISVLNNQHGGKAHLLLSVPPSFTVRNIRVPQNDFFAETLNPWHAKDIFFALHRLLTREQNNINIRDGRDYRIQEYVDAVIKKMWQLRLFLSDFKGELSSSLNKEQQIWLYPEYEQYRIENNDWLDHIVLQMSRSLNFGYKKVLAQHAILLSDDVFMLIEKVVKKNKEALR